MIVGMIIMKLFMVVIAMEVIVLVVIDVQVEARK